MRYATVCSGIESPSVAWHPLGWRAQFYSEIEPFPSAVLAHHYPETPNHGDMLNFRAWPDTELDILAGGTPCQSFSVAGLREGLADPRGNLALTYLAIAERYRPRWVLWENVPGVLSSHGGRDFAAFLGALAQLGYGWAYRVLDAQYYGVPQRRRRVFVVGYLGSWGSAAAVLFERACLSGHIAPSREPRENITGPIAGCSNGGGANGPGRTADDAASLVAGGLQASAGGSDENDAEQGRLIASNAEGSTSLPFLTRSNLGKHVNNQTPLIAHSHSNIAGRRREDDVNLIAFHSTQDPINGAVSPSVGAGNGAGCGTIAVAFAQNSRDEVLEKPVLDSLKTGGGKPGQSYPAIRTAKSVRRLMPRECERLQGLPDDWTAIPWGGRPADKCPDSPRYKAIGNSMAAPVIRWLGERIQLVDEVMRQRAHGA